MQPYPYSPESHRGSPIRPPLKNERPSETVHAQNGSEVKYDDPKTGQPIPVTHPEILGQEAESRATFNSTNHVQVRVGPDNVRVSFNDYLAMMDVSYDEYIRVRGASEQTNSRLFKDLHQESIQRRLKGAQEREQWGDLKNYEDRQTARQEIEGFLIKNINASGYGEARAADPQNDHFDKIDLFIKVDPAKHKLPGKAIYFGLQHTALNADKDEKLQQKMRDTLLHPDNYIPEHPEYGRVTKFFYREDRTRYFPEYGDRRSYDSVLNRLQRKLGHAPKPHEAYMYTTDGRRNDTTEAQARLETVRRTYELYQHFVKTLDEYLAESNEFFKRDFQQKKETLQGLINLMEKENPELLQ